MVTTLQPWNRKVIASWQESYDKPRQCGEKQRHKSANKGPYSQGYCFPSGHVGLWELDRKEGSLPKNRCSWTVLLEKTPESPLDSKAIKLVNLKGKQSWKLIWRTDAEAQTQVFWSSDANSQLIGKVPEAGKDWKQKKERASEDEMAYGIINAMNMNLSKLWKMVRDRKAWHAAVHVFAESQIQLGDWTTT